MPQSTCISLLVVLVVVEFPAFKPNLSPILALRLVAPDVGRASDTIASVAVSGCKAVAVEAPAVTV